MDHEHDPDLARERAEFAALCRTRGECIVWVGRTHSGTGRPIWQYGGRNAVSARRWLWQDEGRELPDGCYLKPGCGHEMCINPAHAQVGARK